MKKIDSSKYTNMITEPISKHKNEVEAKRKSLEAELLELRSDLALAEDNLMSVKNDINEFRKVFRKISEIKEDIAAIEHFLVMLEEEKKEIKNEAVDAWNRGAVEFNAYIQPFHAEYEKKVEELFELYLEITAAEHSMKKIKNTFPHYEIVDGVSQQVSLSPVKQLDAAGSLQFFRKVGLKKTNNNNQMFLELMNHGRA